MVFFLLYAGRMLRKGPDLSLVPPAAGKGGRDG
jgi:hypothetical protein